MRSFTLVEWVAVYNLYIGSYQHIIAYFYTVVIYKRTIHVDDYLVAYKDVFPVFAMEIDIYMHPLSQAPEHFTQQGLFTLCIGIVGGVELRQKSPCAQDHFHDFRVIASDEGLSRHTFLILCLHNQKCFYFIRS